MDTLKLIGIYGASGFGREVLPLVRDQYPEAQICFIDDYMKIENHLNGCKVYSYKEFINLSNTFKAIIIAIADGNIRRKLAEKCFNDKLSILSVRASNSVILDEVKIGTGSVICHFSQLTSNIKIGKCFHANLYSYVAHDCIIGDYVTFAPNVRCNGNVHINDFAYIGTGAVIKNGKPDNPIVIGKSAVVGMGAVVTKSVPEGAVVIGNPARPLLK